MYVDTAFYIILLSSFCNLWFMYSRSISLNCRSELRPISASILQSSNARARALSISLFSPLTPSEIGLSPASLNETVDFSDKKRFLVNYAASWLALESVGVGFAACRWAEWRSGHLYWLVDQAANRSQAHSWIFSLIGRFFRFLRHERVYGRACCRARVENQWCRTVIRQKRTI